MNIKKSLGSLFSSAKRRLFKGVKNLSESELAVILVETYTKALERISDYGVEVSELNSLFFDKFENKLKAIGVNEMENFLTETLKSVVVVSEKGITPTELADKGSNPKDEPPFEEEPKYKTPVIKTPAQAVQHFLKSWNYLKKKMLNNTKEAYAFNLAFSQLSRQDAEKMTTDGYIEAYFKVAEMVDNKGYSIQELEDNPFGFVTGQKKPMDLTVIGKYLNVEALEA